MAEKSRRWFLVPARVVILRCLVGFVPLAVLGVLLWTVAPSGWRDQGTVSLCIASGVVIGTVMKASLD